ncbi:hypothetical protein OVA24_15090 [Luteolibacter sp. SL250]|uniref:hypothetical protein n=1 Tax=Luteolibacter sp. SL250 TaxID=2995170 RepID=UPI00226ED7FE|nr:hypothetical protein [Luteolibacter sp. SL250]WAC18558.1 hypothetical protein OVA24_15090 [Luteolibacter sp. SL250]
MKPIRIHHLLALLPALSACPYARAANIVFTVSSGNWNSSNWTGGGVPPGSSDSGLIRGNRTVTLDQDQGTIINVFLGEDSGYGTLLFNAGGSLNLTGTMDVMRRASGSMPDAVGTLTMTGGALTSAGGMYVGVGGAGNTGTSSGTATISGGSYTGAVSIGSISVSTAVGVFNVVGSSASIGDGGAARSFSVNPYGTLGFTLGATGVSTLDYAASAVNFANGSSIVIDGSAYTGTGGDLVLINGGTLTGTAARTFTGFTGFTPELIYNQGGDGDLILRLTAVPEPAVITLASGWMAFGLRRRRTRSAA